MKTKFTYSFITLTLWLAINLQPIEVQAQGTAFTYQGRLSSSGAAANGLYDFRFRLYTDPAGSFQVGSNYLTNAVPTSNGLFTVPIDFGAGVFTGTTNWLEVGVRTNGVGTFTVLNPLQRLTPTPYAIFAETANTLSGVLPASQLSGAVGAANLSGTYGNAVNLNNAGNNFNGGFNGQFNGNGGGLTNLNAWALTGNSNTAPGMNFLGTADNQPLEIRVNNQRVLHIESTTNTPNIIGGWSNNFAAPGVVMATISGGGGTSVANGSLNTNSVWSSYGTVGGGLGNQAGSTNGDPSLVRGATVGGGANNTAGAHYSTVSGGTQNTIMLSGDLSQIGGGQANQVQPGASYSVIGGGQINQIQTNSFDSTIGGGQGNQIQTNSPAATIAGGYYNSIMPNSQVSTIGGGYGNQIQSNSIDSTIGGGYYNLIGTDSYLATIGGGYFNQATNSYATVPGGYNNMAGGLYSFAAGYSAQALHQGSFVLADSSGGYFDSTTSNEFSIRAQNGVRIQSDTGIHLNAGDLPLIVRDWDVFATNAPSFKAGIGRWGLFMEYSSLTIGIPGDDLSGRTFQVAKYNTNGTPTTLMLVDQVGNVTANSFNATGGGTFNGNGSGLTGVALLAGGNSLSGNQNITGNLSLADPLNSIQFPATSGANSPMIYMFASNTVNADRMVIAHSPTYPNWGLQYSDVPDKFNFLGGGLAVMTVDLAGQKVGIGTTNPAAKLDVRGDIKMGTNSEYFATGGSENLRIVRGIVNSSGGIYNGSGFTVAHTGTGTYTLTFNVAFTDVPALTLTAYTTTSPAVANCTTGTASSYSITTWVGSVKTDSWWNFTAIGGR